MTTVGQALNVLLQANGVPGNVVAVQGGPSALEVTFRQRDLQDRVGDLHTMTLNLHEQASSELDGVTEPPSPNVQTVTPGEFAAVWNSWTDGQRQGFLHAMRAADDLAVRCRMVHQRTAHGDVDFDGYAGPSGG